MLYINEFLLLACNVAGHAHRINGLKVLLGAPCTMQALSSSNGAAGELERRMTAVVARAALERGLGHNQAPAGCEAALDAWLPRLCSLAQASASLCSELVPVTVAAVAFVEAQPLSRGRAHVIFDPAI